MTEAAATKLEERVLVIAPTAKDADLTRGVFEKAGVCGFFCRDMDELCAELKRGAGAILVPEEVVAADAQGRLARYLGSQPAWSDLPVLILAYYGANSSDVLQAIDRLGNVTVVERPTRVLSLMSAVRTALRARQRQYQIRRQIVAQRLHAETQALFASIVESSDDAIISKDLHGRILTWNTGAERLFGYTALEAIGQSITMLIPPERQSEETAILDRLRQGERIGNFETIRVTKDGRRLDISLTISPIRTAEGGIIGASKVARDITARKQIEATLREGERRKDEFLATLAHELRNPLAPILNSLQVLRFGERNESTTKRIYSLMERQVNHIVRLVDDLLEVSRITNGKIELRRQLVEVAELLHSAVETSRPFIDAAGHTLEFIVPPEPMFLEGDPVRLSQIFANLLNNAAKYTDGGGRIWVSARHERDRLAISVRDNGIGIPADMLPAVFDLFTQIDRSGRGQGGLGIGLTLVKKLVEMHGGNVYAYSEGHGKGTEFVVRLPLAPNSCLTEVMRQKTRPRAVLPPRRVLVVDDNRDVAESLAMLLGHLSAEVRIAHSGPDALKMLVSRPPDIVFMDIGMPGMDGYEVAYQIRQQPELRNLVLVALTGWGQEDDRRRSRKAGFDHHLVKPAGIEDLERLMKSLGNTRRDARSKAGHDYGVIDS
jgi:PAS domain S-box-containing protein